jgi:hypothetical protein
MATSAPSGERSVSTDFALRSGHLIAVAAYLGLGLLSIVLLNSADNGSAWPALVPQLGASLGLGWVTRSWSALPFALAPVVLGLPFGYADAIGEDYLIWLSELFLAPLYALLIAAGVVVGRRFRRQP